MSSTGMLRLSSRRPPKATKAINATMVLKTRELMKSVPGDEVSPLELKTPSTITPKGLIGE